MPAQSEADVVGEAERNGADDADIHADFRFQGNGWTLHIVVHLAVTAGICLLQHMGFTALHALQIEEICLY